MKVKMNLKSKMLIYILTTALIIYAVSLGYIGIKVNNTALDNAKELAGTYTKEYANYSSSDLSVEMDMARALAQVAMGYKSLPSGQMINIYNEMLEHLTVENTDFLSSWIILELSAIWPEWEKTHGRLRLTYFRSGGQIETITEVIDTIPGYTRGTYYDMLERKIEYVMDPYYHKYNELEEELIMTSVGVNIMDNGVSVGVAGFDLGLQRFQDLISTIHPIEGSYAFLIAYNGQYVAHKNENMIGTFIQDSIDDDSEILSKIQKGKEFNREIKGVDGKEYWLSYAPVKIGNSPMLWSFGFAVPVDIIMAEERATIMKSILVGLIGLILTALIIWLIAHNISRPIIKTTKVLGDLAAGDIDESKKIVINTKDEIAQMNNSVNTLIDGLNRTAVFAREIGEGNLDIEFDILSDKDVLGNSLLEMRKSLKIAKEQEEKRKLDDQKQNWATEGLAMFGKILRQNNDDMKEFAYHIISNVVKYIDANQGGLFIINDEDKNDVFIELLACYAYERRKYLEKRIEVGVGLIGRCVQEQKVIHMTELPEEYITITSGLGKAVPNSLLIIPLIVNDVVFGVIEVAGFNKFENHIVKFIEEVGESIASTISSAKINIRTSQLLEQSQQQSEEMAAQEEEMRQNMEELQATQEEAGRRSAEMQGLLDALNNSSIVSEYDPEGNLIEANENFCKVFNKTRNELVEKIQYNVLTSKNKENNEFWNKVKAGKVIKVIANEKFGANEVWLSETYSPIYDSEENLRKVLCIAVDISESKEQERIVQELYAESKQNNEQLSAGKAELDHESSLLNALMNSVPDYIYFKDLESKFVRISKSHAKLLGFDDPKELLGKSDFDFFSKDHAKPAFEDEQKIIKTGKPIINQIEKELWEDGSFSWVRTSKMPLKTQDDETIGTFGISKDITDLKRNEIEVEQQRKLFDLLALNTQTMVYKINKKGKFVEHKGASFTFTNIKEKDIIGTKAIDLYPDLKNITEKELKSKKPYSFTSKQKDHSLKHFIIEDSNSDGSLIGIAFRVK